MHTQTNVSKQKSFSTKRVKIPARLGKVVLPSYQTLCVQVSQVW